MTAAATKTSLLPARATPKPAALLAVLVAAGATIWLARHGAMGAGPRATAYAEVLPHSAGPLAEGRVEEVRVQVGQRVKAGEVIAVMDGKALRLGRERAAADLAKLQADVIAASEEEEASVTRSELWTLRARAEERSDRAELAEVQARLTRLEGLFAKQMVPASEVEATREKWKALTARVQTYDRALVTGQAGLAAQADPKKHKTIVESRIEPARKAVLAQEAELRRLDHAIEELVVRSPVEGVVSLLSHRAGEVIPAGTEIARVVTSRPGGVIAIVPEKSATRVAVGQAADVRRAGLFARALPAKVIEVSPEIDEAPVRARVAPSIPVWGRRVAVKIEGTEGEILAGEALDVSFR